MKYFVTISRQLLDLVTSLSAIQKISFALTPFVFLAVFLMLSHRVAAASIVWDGGGATNNWSEPANWSGDVVPSSGDVAVFDGTSTKSANIDSGFAGSVAGIQINSGYTGTITHASGATLTAGGSGFSQSAGSFTGGINDINVNSTFTLNGGTFNAPSGTLACAGNVTIAASATFNPNNGAVAFAGSSSTTLTVPASLTLNNITVNKTNGANVFFNSLSTLVATGTLTLTDGVINVNNGGTIDAQGGVTIAPTFDGGNATVLISGVATRTVTFPVGAAIPSLTVNAPNVILNASGAPGTITFSQPVDVQSAASLNNGAVNFVFSSPIAFGAVNFTPGSGDVTFNSSFAQTGGTFGLGSGALNFNSTFTLNGGTFNAPSGVLTFAGSVTIAGAATFNPNGGTVAFGGSSGATLTAPASLTLNNITVNKTNGASLFFNSTSTLVATGTLTLIDGVINVNNGGTIDAQGAVSIASTFDGSTVTVLISGAATRTVTLPVGAVMPVLTVNAPNVTLNASGAPGTITFGQPLDMQSAAAFTNGAVNFVFSNPFTLGAVNFTPGSGDVTFNSSFTQTGGTFGLGSGALNFNSTFTLNGGTFNAPSGILTFASNVTIAAAATFNSNGGTVAFAGSSGTTLTAPASLTLNNITFNKTNGVTVFFSSTSTLVAAGTLTLTDGLITVNNGGTIDAQGAVSIASTFDGSQTNLSFSGPANQIFTNNGGGNPTGTWTVNKSSGNVTLASDLTLQAGQALNITQGVLDQGASFNLTAGPITVGSAGRLQNRGIGDLTLTGNVTNNGIINFNGGGIANCGDPDSILIRSLPDMTVRTWSGSGSFSMQDVDVKDQMAGNPPLITAFSSTDSGNNTNWTFDAGCNPTEVTLESFTATGYDDGQVLLQWHTGFEVDNLGFNVYRQEARGKTRLNRSMIAGSALIAGPGTRLTAGHSYSWKDSLLRGKQDTQYWLESVDLHGESEWHGPVTIQKAEGSRQKAGADQQALTLGEIGVGEERDTCSPLEAKAQIFEVTLENLQAQATLAAQAAVKIAVKGEGWYRITQPELLAAGFDTRVNPRLLQVFVDGTQLPILVQGEQDGSFDAGDSVEFYGIGVDTPFTDARVYWLVAGDQSGLRINQAKREGAPSPSRSFTYTVERRDRNIYFSGLRNGEKENFFGAVVGHNPVDQELTLVHLAQADSAQAQLEIGLQGVNFGDHHVGVRLNGLPVGELAFHDQAQSSASFAVANSILREGANTVQLTPLSGESDISLVDYLRVSYQHSYTADNNALKLTATSNQLVTIDGFTSKSIRVFDVTDSQSPEELLGQVTRQKSGYSVTVASPGQGQRELIAFTTEQRPASLRFNKTSNLRSGSASFIIITRAEFADALRPLVALRQRQGLSVSLVDIEDIYDEFSFGQKSPYAVRDFLAYAKSVWKKKPRFVLFAGDASFDPKNYLGFGDSDLVPTKLIDTEFMETSSDDWVTDFDGDGIADIATGRLPARTAEELSRMVAKIVSYEQASPSDEALLVADANEGFDFEQANTELKSLISDNLRITQVNRGRLTAEMARSSLFEALYRRQFLVNYAGHGSVNQWRANLLTNDDALALRNEHLPMFVMMTCLTGYFHDPALDSLGESLIKADGGGAVAVWASSGMTMPADQALVNQELYRLLFNSGGATTIGEAVMRAKSASSSSDVRRTWVLLGDPAMKLR